MADVWSGVMGEGAGFARGRAIGESDREDRAEIWRDDHASEGSFFDFYFSGQKICGGNGGEVWLPRGCCDTCDESYDLK